MVTKFLMVALGGGFGAMSRYALSLAVPYKSGFPWATFSVNLIGSLLIGVAYVVIVERALVAGHYRELLMIGFLGALTTFSTFSLEILAMIENNQPMVAVLYVVLSLVFCIVAAFLGASITRLV